MCATDGGTFDVQSVPDVPLRHLPSIDITRDGDIATVALNNPGKLNALTIAMWSELARVMRDLSADDALRCIVLRGAGNEAFAAGAALAEFVNQPATPAQGTAHD